ncbi:MAG: glutamine--fructose-6-phosphate transaminase (isomerizing) [Chitinivibrionales bacterium]
MCGIVGYTGRKDALNILLDGLRMLEYRGYDSAGVALNHKGALSVYKTKGKISSLANLIGDQKLKGKCGIGHTRWATHGAPSDVNSHPHTDDKNTVAVVHNGIIENYQQIKQALIKKGKKFSSETDSEVIASLIAEHHKELPLADAVKKTVRELKGAYGIAVISYKEPGTIIGAKQGSPLVLGIGENEYILASDASAIVKKTKKVIYLEDNNIAVLTPEDYTITTVEDKHVDHEIQTLEFDAEKLAKGTFEHFMLKEIFEQPESIANSMRGRLIKEEGVSHLGGLNLVQSELRRIKRIIILACGTSWHAGITGEYMIEDLAGIPVEVEYASEFRYRNPIIGPDTIIIAISQSGETADTLAAVKEASRRGATVLGICNVVGSSIARTTHGGVYLHAGPEIGVASTKAFTSQITVLALLTLSLGRMRRISHSKGMEICNSLDRIPSQIQEILDQNGTVKSIAELYHNKNNFLFLGRSYNYPVALEGALKLKEISYIHAEGYPAAEMKHGPIALIEPDMPTVIIALKDSVYDKILSNMEEIKARGGKIIAIANMDDNEIERYADHVIRIPVTLPVLSPFLSVIPLQLLAYHIAAIRGCEIDQPRNLAKSVTVE